MKTLKSIFLTEIKVMLLIVKMPSIIDIIIQIYLKLPRHVFGDFWKKKFMTKWPSYNFHTWKLYDKHFLSKILNHFCNDQKASKEAIGPKMFIKNF